MEFTSEDFACCHNLCPKQLTTLFWYFCHFQVVLKSSRGVRVALCKPDRPFCKFVTPRSGYQRILCSSGGLCIGFEAPNL